MTPILELQKMLFWFIVTWKLEQRASRQNLRYGYFWEQKFPALVTLLVLFQISDEVTFDTQERETWFSDIPKNGGFAFTYKADSNQISFLQMLSTQARTAVCLHF